MTASIQINLDAELAQFYNHSSGENQKKLQILVSLWLRDKSSLSNAKSLHHVMNEISNKAIERGLTFEVLEAILKDE